MRKNKGITMMSLVITIVVLLLLSTMTINLSFDAYNIVKEQNFVAKMKVIQSKVDNIAEEMDNASEYGSRVGDKESVLSKIIASETINKNNSWDNELDSNPEHYSYFTPETLETQLGLKDQDMAVFINFKTRNVISEKGVKKDKKIYYRQYDLENGENLHN